MRVRVRVRVRVPVDLGVSVGLAHKPVDAALLASAVSACTV